MDWLLSLDISLFRLINRDWSNPLFDAVMPLLGDNRFFFPALAVLAAGIIWKGNRRSRYCLIALTFVFVVGNLLVCGPLKNWLHRPRPFEFLSNVNVLMGRGGSGSMPSSHTFNWFAATMVLMIYYRRSFWVMLPLAVGVGFSRIYTGMHFPSDVLAGAMIGAGSAAVLVFGLNRLWKFFGPRWFESWYSRFPSLVDATVPHSERVNNPPPSHVSEDIQYLRFGYIVIGVLFLFRLVYLASGKIELSEDEAYQWVWSKHLALSYYSKPPMIAYTQFLGTSLWGDNEFGVRFFSPVITALVSVLLLRFMAREINARVGFWLVLVLTTTPMLAVGSTLMTIDPLNVLFWTVAMFSVWRAIRHDSTRDWGWAGLWMGLGFLSKYTALFQWLSLAVFFVLWPGARRHLRRPGPYVALVINLCCMIPVLIWNHQHGWITVTHLANRGGLDSAWKPTTRFLLDYAITEPLLLNPFFFVGMIWAMVAFWKQKPRSELSVFLFSMGAPLFLFYSIYTLRARVQGNWIAPAVIPLFCLSFIYWNPFLSTGRRLAKPVMAAGLAIGAIAVIVMHDTNLVNKATGRPLPANLDPLRRVRAWSALARVVNESRLLLQERQRKPAFIIGDHYGVTGLMSFYIPEAREAIKGKALVYYQSTPAPANQFYFWPGYQSRKGENAIYVQQTDTPQPPPERLVEEFRTVRDLGIRDVMYRGRVFHKIQLFECVDLL